jgi:hypothetical protein
MQDHSATHLGVSREAGPSAHRVGWAFIARYALAYMGTCLMFLAPLLVTLALKIESLVGIDRGPANAAAAVAARAIGNPA